MHFTRLLAKTALQEKDLFRYPLVAFVPSSCYSHSGTLDAFGLFVLVFEARGWCSSAELYKPNLGSSDLLEAENALPWQHSRSWSVKSFLSWDFNVPQGVELLPTEWFCSNWTQGERAGRGKTKMAILVILSMITCDRLISHSLFISQRSSAKSSASQIPTACFCPASKATS